MNKKEQVLSSNELNSQKNTLLSIFYHIINGMVCCVFFALLISNVFFNRSPMHSGIGTFLIVLGLFILLLITYKIITSLYRLLNKCGLSFYKMLLVAFILLIPVQFILVYSIYTPIGWDPGQIAFFVHAPAGVHSFYFSVFSSNLFIFFMFRFLNNIFTSIGMTDYWFNMSIINIIAINFAILFTCLITKELFGKKPVALVFIFSAILFGLFPYLVVPYSDTISMPVITALSFFSIKAFRSKTKKQRIVLSVICGLLFALGWLIKPHVIAVLASIFVVLFLYFIHKKSMKTFVSVISCLLIGALSSAILFISFNFFVNNQVIISFDTSIRDPLNFHIAVGLVDVEGGGYGGWNEEALNHVARDAPTHVKREAYCEFILDKLREHGFVGYIIFLTNKARWVTSEGTFFWGLEGSHFGEIDPNRNFFTNIFYPGGSLNLLWHHAANGFWMIVFFGMVAGMVLAWKKDVLPTGIDCRLFVRLMPFLLLLVILVTEGRSRYLIPFLPAFCIISAYGYERLFCLIQKLPCILKKADNN